MKKLLSLLSVLTISGTAMPNVIASSSYEKRKLNNDINYLQTNNLETLRNKRENNNFLTSKIVIEGNSNIYSSGVVLNNKLYFNSKKGTVYEYDIETKTTKIIISDNGYLVSDCIILNNKIYVGINRNLHQYDPVTKEAKIVNSILAEGPIISAFVLNDKIYFASRKWTNINNTVFYEYDPVTKEAKIVREFSEIIHHYFVLNKKFYICIENNLHEYNFLTWERKIIISANGIFKSSGVILKNKLYIGSWDNKFYEYDFINNQQKLITITNGKITSFGVVLNNKFYFGSFDGKVYEYDPLTKEANVIINTNGAVYSSGVVLNNKIYFGSLDNNVYEYIPFDPMKANNDLINDWLSNFNNWKKEIDRQLKEDFPKFSLEQKRSWKGDKKNELHDKIHSLKQDLNIIVNSQIIKRLYNSVVNLEINLNTLKNELEALSNTNTLTCANIATVGAGMTAITVIATTSTAIPVIGSIAGGILTIIAGYCAISN